MSTPASAHRQRLLKRVLPALVVLVVYFSSIGPRISASALKADQEMQRLKDAYWVGQGKLNELAKQKEDLLDEMAALRKQESSRETTDAPRQQGFTGQPDYPGQTIGRLSTAMSRYRLRVIEDGRQDWNAAKDSIPQSVQELGGPTKGGEPGASLWRVRFSGTYPDVYRVLDELSREGVVVIPVSLDMVAPEAEGDIEWTIRVWI